MHVSYIQFYMFLHHFTDGSAPHATNEFTETMGVVPTRWQAWHSAGAALAISATTKHAPPSGCLNIGQAWKNELQMLN